MGKRTACLHQLGDRRAGTVRFGRFLHNPAVSAAEMLETVARHTATAAHGRHVLAIQDTTELNFSGHAGSKKGFGYVGNGRDTGLFLHPVIVVDAGCSEAGQVGHAGGILGLADAFLSSRAKASPKGRKARAAEQALRPISGKETRCWMDGLASADRVLGAAAMVTLVADRASDIYEEFAARAFAGARGP